MTGSTARLHRICPAGTLFETLALVFSDAVISALMEAKKEGALEMKGRAHQYGITVLWFFSGHCYRLTDLFPMVHLSRHLSIVEVR